MKQNIIFLILLIVVKIAANAQNPKHWIANFQPTVLLEPVSGIKAGVEYRFSKKYSVASDFCFRYNMYKIDLQQGESSKMGGIQVQPEFRMYIGDNNKYYGSKKESFRYYPSFYINVRTGITYIIQKQQRWVNVTDANTGRNFNQLIDFTKTKNNIDLVFGLGYQLGDILVGSNTIGVEFFGGVGVRRRSIQYIDITNGFDENFVRSRFNDELTESPVNGIENFPIVQFGAKIIYRIK